MKTAAPPSRMRRNLWIAAVVLAVFTLVGFVIVPPILKSQLEKRLSTELGRTVTVGKVRFNPYALSLTLENFDVRSADGKGSFLGWGRLYVNFDALASLRSDWVLGEIELDAFHVAPEILADGTLNFADIIAKLKATIEASPKSDKPGRPLRVGSLKVRQARVDFEDLSRKEPFRSTVGPLTFALTEFRTVGARGAPYHLEAVTEAGEKFAWAGTLAADPVASRGDFQITDLILKKYAPYTGEKIQSDITDGKLTIKGSYEIALGGQTHVIKLTNGEVHLRNLKVTERATQQPALELASLDVTGAQADALAMNASVASVAAVGGHAVVRREKDGAINLITMFLPAKAGSGTAPPPSSPGAPLPQILIGAVSVKDFRAEFNDLAAPRPAQLGINNLQLALKNVTLADGVAIPTQVSFDWTPQGTVSLEGTVTILPALKADLKTSVTGVELLPLSPYLEQFVNARLTQGSVTTNLSVQAEMPEGKPLAATVTGDVKLEKFGLVDSAHNAELAGVAALELKGLKASTTPTMTVSLDEIAVTAPYARVAVAADKSLNLASVIKTEPKPAGGTPPVSVEPAVAGAQSPKITVARVVITEGDFSFADRSVEPNVQMTMNQFGGTISGLSSENLAKASVDLKAVVNGAGPVAITGELDPLGTKKVVDLKIDLKNMDLLPFSPYSGKYAGFELARGKLLLDVKFVLDGSKIDSKDVITLHQFTFGNRVESPEATHLPVRLGVALLKDRDGKIIIDVPIQGSLDDPNFRIGAVVVRVVVNLLTKAAVSPFSLLGSMFGGGGEELAYQEFNPGGSTLQPGEIKKLDTMVNALTNRPALSVSLEGSYDGPADTYALKQQKLRELIRHAVWEEKHAATPTIPPPEQLEISSDESAAMLQKLFDEKFPPGTGFGAPIEKKPEVAAAPEPERRKGIFGRMVDVVTLKKLRKDKHKETKVETVTGAKNTDTVQLGGPTIEEMTGRLTETIQVNENDLRALAAARAQQVRDYFINVGKISPERLFLAKDGPGAAKAGKGPRVFLSLQ